jgi:hypothetical protein
MPPAYRANYGFVPSYEMPSFSRPPEGGFTPRALLRPPMMLIMRSCSNLDTATTAHRPVLFKDKFGEALYTEATVERTVGGSLLTNGVGVLTLLPGAQMAQSAQFSPTTDVAFADKVAVVTTSGRIDLFMPGAPDQIPVPTTAGTSLTLTWTWANNIGRADFWEVTLLELSGPLPAKRRIYTTTNVTRTPTSATSELKVAAADLDPGKQYVFEISAFTGRPDATAAGDFARVVGNQAISVVHTHSFIATP